MGFLSTNLGFEFLSQSRSVLVWLLAPFYIFRGAGHIEQVLWTVVFIAVSSQYEPHEWPPSRTSGVN